MASDQPSPKPPASGRPARWSAANSSPVRPNCLAFRLIGIPVLAVAGVLLYRGVHDRFVLPECNSTRAKNTLADVLKQLEVAPLRNEPIKTISASRDQVVCNVALPLSGGDNLDIDYSFFWQGSTAQMKYSISRRPGQNPADGAPHSQ